MIRALLAERHADTRQMYGEYLRRSAVELDEASDGREALAKALSHAHDVIVTETRLPGINGYDLCQLLRGDLATRATPIVVVTGEAFPADVDRARQAGADAVLVKPCLPDALLAEIWRVVARSRGRILESQALLDRVQQQIARSREATARHSEMKRGMSRGFNRRHTTTPPLRTPLLVCPTCDQTLTYRRSYVGGVSERHSEQWDYFECINGCGIFQYRQRTRKLRKVF